MKCGMISIWPPREVLSRSIPHSIKEKYPNLRCIIDCVEVMTEVPLSLVMFNSDYKSHTTIKCLVGISPGGGFSFLSSVFPGSISDKEITILHGILSPTLWEKEDGLMAVCGFTIAE